MQRYFQKIQVEKAKSRDGTDQALFISQQQLSHSLINKSPQMRQLHVQQTYLHFFRYSASKRSDPWGCSTASFLHLHPKSDPLKKDLLRETLSYERHGSVWCSSSPSMLILTSVQGNFWRQVFKIRKQVTCLQGRTYLCVAGPISLALLLFVLLLVVSGFIFPPLLVLKCPLVSSASIQLHLFLQLQTLCPKPSRNTSTSWSSNKLYLNHVALRVFSLRKDT